MGQKVDVDLVAVGSGLYRVFVNGAKVSEHTQERKASERAVEENGDANPSLDCSTAGCGWHVHVTLEGWAGGHRNEQL
jgi:hypothetical protein